MSVVSEERRAQTPDVVHPLVRTHPFVMPASTGAAVTTKLNLVVQAILKQRDIQERLVTLGADPIFKPVDAAKKYFHEELGKWAQVVKASGAKAE